MGARRGFYPSGKFFPCSKHLAYGMGLAHRNSVVNSNSTKHMLPLRLLAYLFGVVLLSALVSPPIYWIGTALAEAGWLPIVKGFPFHRYFSRCVQISSLLLLWPAFRWIGIRRFSELGIERNPRRWHDVFFGFVLAFLPVLLLGCGYFFFDLMQFRGQVSFSSFIKIFSTAAEVSCIEEFLFRGVLLGLLLMAMRRSFAIGLSALFFALVHFLKTSKSPGLESVGWGSGFSQLSMFFSGAPPWPIFAWGMGSLMVAGIILGVAATKTRSLFLPIGLHAGWILGQQGIQWIGKWHANPADASLPWVGPNVVSGAVPTGLMPVLVLIFTGLLVIFYLKHAARQSS